MSGVWAGTEAFYRCCKGAHGWKVFVVISPTPALSDMKRYATYVALGQLIWRREANERKGAIKNFFFVVFVLSCKAIFLTAGAPRKNSCV